MAVKILSVDDELDLEILLKQYFRRKIRKGEYEFSFAHNGLEALKMVIVNSGIDCQYSKIKASVDLYNMLNKDYYQGGSFILPIPQQKFNFLAKVSYVF